MDEEMIFPILINTLTGEEIPLDKNVLSIGRGLHNNIVLCDIAVSRNHCCFEKVDDNWVLFDTSLNGTTINKQKSVKKCRHVLSNGDVITLSNNTEYKFVRNNPIVMDVIMPTDIVTSTTEEIKCVKIDVEINVDEKSKENKLEESNKNEIEEHKTENINDFEDELTCSICTELFIKAITLNCSHTFCQFCINTWKKNKTKCPLCRKPIKTLTRTVVIDNTVEKMVEKASADVKEQRKKLVEDRKELEEQKSAEIKSETIVLESDSSEEDYEEEYDDEDYDENNDEDDVMIELSYASDMIDDISMEWTEYNGLPGVYYGGHGRCYTCGEAGHWSNGCPTGRARRRY